MIEFCHDEYNKKRTRNLHGAFNATYTADAPRFAHYSYCKTCSNARKR